jgi:conjugal transfer mating pair stabilization protein TraG
MTSTSRLRKLKKQFRRTFTKRNAVLVGIFILLIVVLWAVMHPRNAIAPAAYKPLLEVIANAESRGNYNAYFGHVANKEINFTAMTIRDVIQWQEQYVAQGSASSAVGRYQIIRPTLLELVQKTGVSLDETFNATIQDQFAITLMEKRGSIDFAQNKVSAENFAHELSKEWASLPRVIGSMPEDSFYAGDGLNKSLVDSKSSLAAIYKFKEMVQ